MRRSSFALCFAVSLFGSLAFSMQAQPEFQPVVTENHIDGTLIGLEGGYGFDFGLGVWKPFAGLAYGLDSQKIRHKLGLQVGPVSLSHVDWPSDAVAGRAGEMGTRLGIQVMGSRISLFTGELWQKEGPAPQVGYLHLASSWTFHLGYGITLALWSSQLWGMVLPAQDGAMIPMKLSLDVKNQIFQSLQRGLSLRVGQLTLHLSAGELGNRAELEGFEFARTVIGYLEPRTGEKFWAFSAERRFPLIRIPLALPKPPRIPASAWLTELPVQGALFLDGALVTHRKAEGDAETKNLYGWGIGVVVPTAWFELRARIIFDRDGQYTFDVGF